MLRAHTIYFQRAWQEWIIRMVGEVGIARYAPKGNRKLHTASPLSAPLKFLTFVPTTSNNHLKP